MSESVDDFLAHPASWNLACEIARLVPTLKLSEMHPGGGQYDVLAVWDHDPLVLINRQGSIHARLQGSGDTTSWMPRDDWLGACTTPGGVRRLARDVLEACGYPPPAKCPRTKPQVLGYRVLAALVTTQLFERPRWDVRSQYVDSSGAWGSGPLGRLPFAELEGVPQDELWVVRRGDEARAWLWSAWMWGCDGQRLDLMSAYAHGASIPQLVAIVTRRPSTRRAPGLPMSIDPDASGA